MFNFDFGNLFNFDSMDFSGMNFSPEINYDALAAIAVQAAVASPAVVNSPANVAPPAPAVQAVVEQVIEAVVPNRSDIDLTQFVNQVTEAVVTSPEIIASPPGQTVNTTTIQGIVAASTSTPTSNVAPTPTSTQGLKNDSAATPTISAPIVDEKTKAAAYKASAPIAAKPDPTKTAYADLTSAQRAAMTKEEKTDYMKAAREFKMSEEATARAASDPMLNFAERPEAPTPAPGMINYYGWIGGVNSGSWKLYQAPDTPENRAKYGSRSVGGVTQATASSAVGANALAVDQGPGGVPGSAEPVDGDGQFDVGADDATTTPTTTTPTTTTPTTTTLTTSSVTAIPDRPVGTPPAFVYDPTTKTYKMPPKPTGEGNWEFDPNSGWVKSDVILGSSGFAAGAERTLALNTFKNTLGLFFGAQEVTKPWVSELYKYVSGFYKTGSTVDEAFNLALQEGRFNPNLTEFTKRFKGIYALTDLRARGGVIQVPTVAEYFATEAKMGDLLKSSNLGELANEDFLGDVLGRGVSATEFGNRMVAVFDRIDNASDINKKTIARFFPTLDRKQLAKALLTGEAGAKQLQRELSGYEVLAGAEQQGLGVSPTLLGGITNEQAQQIALGGGTYASTLGQFGQIAQARETEQKLAEISGVKSIGVTGLTSAVISKSASELKKLEDLTRQEEARFSAKAGNIGSKTFASQTRANRLI